MTRAYNVVDADGHILEPLTLWDEYIDPAFRDRRPQFVIDETTAMAIARDDPALSRFAFWSTGLALFAFWNIGTLVGALATHAISNPKVFGLDAAPPAAFSLSASTAVTGIASDHCCETTTRIGCDLGFNMIFVSNATHTFDRIAPDGTVIPADQIRRVTEATLSGEFARVCTTESCLSD